MTVRIIKKYWLRLLPIWLSGVFFVTYTFLDPQLKFNNVKYIGLCLIPLLVSMFIGTLLLIRVMKENDHPFLEKGFLLLVLPLLGFAVLTYVVCALIFGALPLYLD
jgi:hypothetical protein